MRRPLLVLLLILVALGGLAGGLAWLLDTPRPAPGAARPERLWVALCAVCHGADGRGSIVARALGLLRPHRLRRMALVQHVGGLAGFDGRGEIYVDPPDYAILNPVAPDRVNLGLVVPLRHAVAFRGRMEMFFHARLKQLRHLSPRLEGMRPVGRLRVLGPLAYRVDEPRHAGVALVGDAAGVFDPFTGEGLYTALRSAELLAETAHAALRGGQVSAEALAPYWRGRRRAFGAMGPSPTA